MGKTHRSADKHTGSTVTSDAGKHKSAYTWGKGMTFYCVDWEMQYYRIWSFDHLYLETNGKASSSVTSIANGN